MSTVPRASGADECLDLDVRRAEMYPERRLSMNNIISSLPTKPVSNPGLTVLALPIPLFVSVFSSCRRKLAIQLPPFLPLKLMKMIVPQARTPFPPPSQALSTLFSIIHQGKLIAPFTPTDNILHHQPQRHRQQPPRLGPPRRPPLRARPVPLQRGQRLAPLAERHPPPQQQALVNASASAPHRRHLPTRAPP